jgi:hypothetical protein
MTTRRIAPGWVAAVALAALLTAGARAGDQANNNNKNNKRNNSAPGVHRMEVYSGARLTVRYFPVNLSPGEASSLRDLERTENEASYVQDLQELKAQYALSERYMELIRRLVQEDLYGKEITRTSFTEAYAYSPYSAGFFAPFWGYYGWGAGAFGGSTRSITLSLANGMGDEGKIKDAFAEVLAKESTSEYAASVNRDRDRAIARASFYPRVKKGAGIAAAADEDETPPVVVTLKDGDEVMGDELDESTKGWVIVKSKDGTKVRVRASEVIKIEEGKRKGVKPGGG